MELSTTLILIGLFILMEAFFSGSEIGMIAINRIKMKQEAKDVYDNLRISSFVSEFSNDIGIAYKLSDLVICRAGANTIAEISAVGIPAILIPYPYATDNHQYWNAYELARIGGALIIKQDELKPERLTELISDLFRNDEELDNMKKINRSLSKPFAAEQVVDKICQTLEAKQTKKKLVSFARFA